MKLKTLALGVLSLSEGAFVSVFLLQKQKKNIFKLRKLCSLAKKW